MLKLRILFYWIRFNLRGKFRDRKSLVHFQQKRLEAFWKNVLPTSPFYSNYFNEGKAPQDFPLMNKELFMEHFETINTKGISKEEALETALRAENERDFSPQLKGVTIGLSTGTSGKRGIFMVSEKERAQWAAMVMTRVVRPKLFKKQKVAFFLRANSNLYSSVQSALFEFCYFDIFKPVEQLAKEVNVFQPDVLAAQPSVLINLAEFQQAKQINITPEQIISFAEVLFPEDKKFIESIFHKKPGEVYQCTEGFLGATCEYGTMHLNEDVVMIEKHYLDEKRFHPVITDFTRSTQPVIRYELNDILVESSQPCPCGSCFTALERIEGRSNDVLLFKNTKGEKVNIYPDLIARLIARATDEFRSYRLIQLSYDKIQIELKTDDSVFDKITNQLEQTILEFLEGREIKEVQLSFKKDIALEQGSKLRKIERRFDDEN